MKVRGCANQSLQVSDIWNWTKKILCVQIPDRSSFIRTHEVNRIVLQHSQVIRSHDTLYPSVKKMSSEHVDFKKGSRGPDIPREKPLLDVFPGSLRVPCSCFARFRTAFSSVWLQTAVSSRKKTRFIQDFLGFLLIRPWFMNPGCPILEGRVKQPGLLRSIIEIDIIGKDKSFHEIVPNFKSVRRLSENQ